MISNISCFSECESIRSGTPVKSDISGTGSVSGYGTGGDSGSDKTPPYLPTSKAHNYATLGHQGKPSTIYIKIETQFCQMNFTCVVRRGHREGGRLGSVKNFRTPFFKRYSKCLP